MSGLGRGGRGALLLKALKNPVKPPGQSTTSSRPSDSRSVEGSQCTTSDSLSGAYLEQKPEEVKPAEAEIIEQSEEKLEKLSLEDENGRKVSQREGFKEERLKSSSVTGTRRTLQCATKFEVKESTFVPSTEKGTHGEEVILYANTIPVRTLGGGAYQYHVSYKPDVEHNGAKYGMLNEHKDVIGSKKAFDGSILFLPHRLTDNVTVLISKRRSDGQPVEISIKFVKALDPSDHQCVHIYNVVLKRVMKLLDMQQVGRHYYNPKASIPIKQHKLELWPGYITAIAPCEGGLMLQTEVSHRLLRQETVLQRMYDMYGSGNTKLKDAVTKDLTGAVVLTRYNNRSYRIDDIDWDKNPQSEFIFHTGQPVTYIDYYKKSYGITINDIQQPLLIHHPKKPQKGKKAIEIVCLIPELCAMTGLTDRMRQDFRVMKDIAVHTRINPSERYQSLLTFIENVNKNPEAVNELKSWGLQLSSDLFMTKGRQMKYEKVSFANGSVVLTSEADFGKDVTRHDVVTAVDLRRWMLVFTRRDERKAMDFKNTLLKVAPQIGIKVSDPSIIMLPDERTVTYLRAIRESKHPETQMVVVIFPTARDDRYAAFKKLCCIEQPVPSQVINARTISQANKLRSVTQKIVLQMNAKMGGELWRLDIPLKSVMVVGIDVYHDTVGGRRSIGAFVANCNKQLTRYYSRVCFQMPGQELIDGLKHCFTAALKKFRENVGMLPEKIIVYRDGVGDSQLSVVADYEVEQLSESFAFFGSEYQPKLAVVVVQKRINMRLFTVLNSGQKVRMENPMPGTVVDHSVTRRDWFDFFLVSQHVRQGTVTPTHYVVVHDKSTLKPDHIQRLTYKLTHLYYNWAGTIRTPAPCQYAHKLASLTGKALHKDPSLELSDKLFYL